MSVSVPVEWGNDACLLLTSRGGLLDIPRDRRMMETERP